MGLINNLTEFHSEFLVELYFNLIKEKSKRANGIASTVGSTAVTDIGNGELK